MSKATDFYFGLYSVHPQSPSEQKAVKNFPEKEARAYPGAAQGFQEPPIISVTV